MMNRAARLYIAVASGTAIVILSTIAEISFWVYIPMISGVLILGMAYVGKEE